MKRIKILAILILAALALFAGMQFPVHPPPAHPTPPGAGEAAARQQLLHLKLPDPRGQEVKLEQWQGKTLVVNFWATWCPPCQKEMPVFSRLQQAWRERGVQFIGIAVDSAGNVERFADKTPVAYPLLVGGTEVMRLSKDLGNPSLGLPFTLIIKADGQIHARKLGGIEENEMDTLLQGATASPVPKQNH